jgi:hypothetical protein
MTDCSSREQVRRTIHFQGPNRVPSKAHDLAPSVYDRYGRDVEVLFRRYPTDILSLPYEPARGWKPSQPGEDEWGCVWESRDDTVGQVSVRPLADWTALASYQAPDPHAPGRLDAALRVRMQLQHIYCHGKLGFALFERCHFLRGYAELLQDLILERERVEKLADRVQQFNLAIIDRYAQAPLGWKVDGIYFTDDWGTQEGLMIRPQMWREIFKPRYAAMFRRCHEHELDVIYHSCGNIMDIIPDLIEIGVDVLHPVQPGPLDLKEVSRRFRGQACFMGGIDTRGVLRDGSPQQVAERVRWCIEHLGTPRGGYILSPSTTILAEAPLENLRAMLQAAAEYGY